MNATKWLLILGIVVLIAGVGAAIRYPLSATRYPAEMPESSGQQTADSAQRAAEGVVCTGYVDLEHGTRSLTPLLPGRIAEIVAKDNQHVEAGAVILRLEDDDAQFQVEEAETAVTLAEIDLLEANKGKEQHRARLAQQQAAVLGAGFRLDAARQTLRRKQDELKEKLVPAEEVDVRSAEVKALEQQQNAEREKLAELNTVDPALTVRKAEAQLKLSRIRCDRARRQLDECTLKAPAAGTVQHISVGAGDIVIGNRASLFGGASSPVVRFAPDEPPLIRAEVDQEFADRIQVGQTALIRDDTHSGASWRGTVQRVAGWYQQRKPTTLDPSAFTDVRTVECLISIDSGQPPLRLGQRMRVMIGRVPASGGE